MSVEIPLRDKDRYFLARQLQNHVILVDDFVLTSQTNTISEVKLEGSKLRYFTRQDMLIRERQMDH
jgi:hypothetical protein